MSYRRSARPAERSVVVRSGANRSDQRGRIVYLCEGHTFKSPEDARGVRDVGADGRRTLLLLCFFLTCSLKFFSCFFFYLFWFGCLVLQLLGQVSGSSWSTPQLSGGGSTHAFGFSLGTLSTLKINHNKSSVYIHTSLLTKYPRASVLFRFQTVFLLGELVSNPLGGYLLSKGPWVPLLTGNVVMIVALALLHLVPETIDVRRWHDARAGRRPEENLRLEKDGILAMVREQMQRIRDFLVTNKRAAILIVPFCFMQLGKYIQELLAQYATKRFGWSWSKVSIFALFSNTFVSARELLIRPC